MNFPIAQTNPRIIDVSDNLPDITANVVHDSEHHQLPSDIFEDVIFDALNDLVDDFAANPDKQPQTSSSAAIRHYCSSIP